MNTTDCAHKTMQGWVLAGLGLAAFLLVASLFVRYEVLSQTADTPRAGASPIECVRMPAGEDPTTLKLRCRVRVPEWLAELIADGKLPEAPPGDPPPPLTPETS